MPGRRCRPEITLILPIEKPIYQFTRFAIIELSVFRIEGLVFRRTGDINIGFVKNTIAKRIQRFAILLEPWEQNLGNVFSEHYFEIQLNDFSLV